MRKAGLVYAIVMMATAASAQAATSAPPRPLARPQTLILPPVPATTAHPSAAAKAPLKRTAAVEPAAKAPKLSKAAARQALLTSEAEAAIAKTGQTRPNVITAVSGTDRLAAKVAFVQANPRSLGPRLWCVPFARYVSGINIQGDAWTWWNRTGSSYAKGAKPVLGAVLNFRATKAMPKGHVAVVSQVIGPREIRVDHANWVRNRISQNVRVIDVSPKNDWSQVRVQDGSAGLGRVNPTYGFIYRSAAVPAATKAG